METQRHCKRVGFQGGYPHSQFIHAILAKHRVVQGACVFVANHIISLVIAHPGPLGIVGTRRPVTASAPGVFRGSGSQCESGQFVRCGNAPQCGHSSSGGTEHREHSPSSSVSCTRRPHSAQRGDGSISLASVPAGKLCCQSIMRSWRRRR